MTDLDRNVRTLLVCFVLALSVLVPLRMLQDNSVVMIREAEVLGETQEVGEGDQMELIYSDELNENQSVEEMSEDSSEVILPDAEVPMVVETEE